MHPDIHQPRFMPRLVPVRLNNEQMLYLLEVLHYIVHAFNEDEVLPEKNPLMLSRERVERVFAVVLGPVDFSNLKSVRRNAHHPESIHLLERLRGNPDEEVWEVSLFKPDSKYLPPYDTREGSQYAVLRIATHIYLGILPVEALREVA